MSAKPERTSFIVLVNSFTWLFNLPSTSCILDNNARSCNFLYQELIHNCWHVPLIGREYWMCPTDRDSNSAPTSLSTFRWPVSKCASNVWSASLTRSNLSRYFCLSEWTVVLSSSTIFCCPLQRSSLRLSMFRSNSVLASNWAFTLWWVRKSTQNQCTFFSHLQ
jgi:hypothetical protein